MKKSTDFFSAYFEDLWLKQQQTSDKNISRLTRVNNAVALYAVLPRGSALSQEILAFLIAVMQGANASTDRMARAAADGLYASLSSEEQQQVASIAEIRDDQKTADEDVPQYKDATTEGIEMKYSVTGYNAVTQTEGDDVITALRKYKRNGKPLTSDYPSLPSQQQVAVAFATAKGEFEAAEALARLPDGRSAATSFFAYCASLFSLCCPPAHVRAMLKIDSALAQYASVRTSPDANPVLLCHTIKQCMEQAANDDPARYTQIAERLADALNPGKDEAQAIPSALDSRNSSKSGTEPAPNLFPEAVDVMTALYRHAQQQSAALSTRGLAKN